MSTLPKTFTKSLSQPDPIPEAGVERAVELMRSGNLFRYGEWAGGLSDVGRLEQELAIYLNIPYICGLHSGGGALFLALKAIGLEPGEPVLVNAFTLTPVPSAITHAGGSPAFVDITEDFVINLEDLRSQAEETGARILLLSYMRGHIPDMDAVLDICKELNLTLVEDCAHTLGATWRGQHLGTFGAAGCYSAQTYKHLNSGEGGFVACRDPELAAKIVLMSGSYMLFGQNGARPSEDIFEPLKTEMPNFSARMSALSAALLRPQLALLAERAETWNTAYDAIAAGIKDIPGLHLPKRQKHAYYVPSSIQFGLELPTEQLETFLASCHGRGVTLKWFGAAQPVGFTSTYRHWQYAPEADLEKTDAVLRGLFDMRLPLHLTPEDCELIAEIIRDSAG